VKILSLNFDEGRAAKLKKKLSLKIIAIAAVVLLPFLCNAATCALASASICVNGDDNTSVWINGHFIGSFYYINWDSTTDPTCMDVPIAYLNSAGNNVIAMAVTDTAGGQVLGSYALDVTCIGGLHSYVTSNDGGIKLDAMNIWNVLPPVDGGGNAWNTLAFNDTAWGNAAPVTCTTWAKPLYSPENGQMVTQYSYDYCAFSGANQYDPSGM
jgi:hypothetical protein